MDVRLALIVLVLLLPVRAWAWGPPPPGPAAGLCRVAIAATERVSGVPDRLMQAIGVMESGRRDSSGATAPWPWTINVEGVGEVFETKEAAVAAVVAHRARGARSIDVGCMQVNLMHHADAFTSLEDAFDPGANTRYAARFLQQLLGTTGSWPRAVAGYHSMTPDIGTEYARKVLAIWARPDLGHPTAPNVAGAPPAATLAAAARPAAAVAADAGAASGPALPTGMAARILPAAGSGAPTFTGRGLDSYRAMPTRLATSSLFRRS